MPTSPEAPKVPEGPEAPQGRDVPTADPEEAPAEPETVLLPQNELVEAIFASSDVLIVRTELKAAARVAGRESAQFWRHDEEAGVLRPVEMPHGGRVIGYNESGGRPLVLLRLNGGHELVDLRSQAITRVLFNGLEPDFVLVAENRHFVFVIHGGDVWAVAPDGRSRQVVMPELRFRPTAAHLAAAVATEDELLIGYHAGEWGGALVSVPMRDGRLGEAREVARRHVRGLVRRENGEVWVLWSVEQGFPSAGLARYQRGQLDTHWEMDEAAGPDAPALLEGAAWLPDGRLVVVCHNGLFAFQPGQGFTALWRGDLTPWYSAGDYDVRSVPMGVEAVGGRLFVATRSMGVLEFRPQGDGYRLARQIPFAVNP
jgi:hypothetical protein